MFNKFPIQPKLIVTISTSINYHRNTGKWSWVTKNPQHANKFTWEGVGVSRNTTYEFLELRAIRKFLEFCPTGCYDVNILSGNENVVKGIAGDEAIENLVNIDDDPQGLLRSWKANKVFYGRDYNFNYWKNKDLKNPEEWYYIHQLIAKHKMESTELNLIFYPKNKK